MNAVSLLSSCLVILSITEGFVPGTLLPSRHISLICRNGAEDDIAKELAKARELLAETREQLDAMEYEEKRNQPPINKETPFFAKAAATQKIAERSKRELVVKSGKKDEVITVKGDEMAKLSEGENWEARPLGEAFENELNENEDVYSLATKQLAQSDVAARIWNLRKTMQTDDYKRIFDKKNRFIGEDI
mmetsp:Transcript_9489/g.10535  ORF Transcript_9489/g.10535 Transcript_9489/m.10535 type:complete len:190 (-) Transcript_9489:211-780(-)|eukprot:CAMPEP_0194145820 /NCGR_PEP_ID=MMETSP0152-20130528/18851_1 /TAXON_ID=1049557 /ORGANISM="Thalassiothrix antarctica, Strain L6-D1" /LENGTH=189 /DNA_ID=CAMNT_0038846167 /DNA_START=160 /DNA_END=729 /DNA_ORIENTATION=+